MNTWKIITIIVIAVVGASIVVASAAAFLATSAKPATVPAVYSNYPGGMMNGYQPSPQTGINQQTTTTTPPPVNAPPAPVNTPIQVNSPPPTTNPPIQTTPITITLDRAQTITQNYLTQLGNPNLTIKAIQEFTNTFYVQVAEKDTGAGAFELAIDKTTGAIVPMQGPTMMWNTKYGLNSYGMMGYLTSTGGWTGVGGMMGSGGMMNWLRGTPTTAMQVAMNQALANAQQYLNANYPGTTVGATTPYYGYYTMQVLNGGNVVGMMSINGTTGQATYYTWCGNFMRQVVFS